MLPTAAVSSVITMPKLLSAFVAGVFAATVSAQLTVVIPNGTATVPGNTSNAFPWGTSAAGWGGLRLMCVYDSANFTNQGVTYPIVITGLKWRPNDGSSAYSGGTFSQATVALSTAAVNYASVTTNYASNHGPDLATVYSGPVVHPGGGGGPSGVVTPWSVDVQFTNSFPYDPTAGSDLAIDVDYPGGSNFVGGSLTQMDVQSAGSMSARVYASSNYPNANGVSPNHGVVVEVSYLPAGPGIAFASSYGDGCYTTSTATFYESFPANTFDLSNNGITLFPAGNGYVVVPGAGAWYTPTSTALPLTDDSVSSAQALGFSLAYPGGTTSSLYVSSNGFIWPQSNTTHGCCNGSAVQLVQQAARWCPLWVNLNPTLGGSIHFDLDVPNSVAYVTYNGVFEDGTTSPNTFQVAFLASGQVEYRYQSCAVTNYTTLTGWSTGNGARDPGGIDLSTGLPVVTSPDLTALSLSAGARPIVGTSVTMTANNVPSASPLGVFIGGLTQHDPGIDLTSFGMPGCQQYVSLDASLAFVPAAGSGSFAFSVPNDPGLSGASVFLQSLVLAAGLNPLGAITSNGVDMVIGTQ